MLVRFFLFQAADTFAFLIAAEGVMGMIVFAGNHAADELAGIVIAVAAMGMGFETAVVGGYGFGFPLLLSAGENPLIAGVRMLMFFQTADQLPSGGLSAGKNSDGIGEKHTEHKQRRNSPPEPAMCHMLFTSSCLVTY
jgi:hypothetical protein